jgi:hypothetical protein
MTSLQDEINEYTEGLGHANRIESDSDDNDNNKNDFVGAGDHVHGMYYFKH